MTIAVINNQDSWLLDDVPVYNGSHNILINGDFESGTLSSWNYSYAGTFNTADLGEVTDPSSPYKRPHTGNYYYRVGVWDVGSYLSQTFTTIPSYIYDIRFSLFSSQLGNSTHSIKP